MEDVMQSSADWKLQPVGNPANALQHLVAQVVMVRDEDAGPVE